MLRARPPMFFIALLYWSSPASANWNEWWTYDGISGPSYWGVINPAWALCNKGRLQSPVDVDPKRLVYDAGLSRISVDKQAVSGVLYNTGQSLVFKADANVASPPVNITGGPLAYRYQFEQLFLHWGSGLDPAASPRRGRSNVGGFGGAADAYSIGSEHAVDGHFFPGEVQLLGFNAGLFRNVSEALLHPHGVVAIAIMVQESDGRKATAKGLAAITEHLKKVIYRSRNFPVSNLVVSDLLPDTDGYMTYEGSATFPGCWETVTWIVLNRPIYLGQAEFRALRELMQGDKLMPKAPLGPNVRPLQPLNGRSIRTNVARDNSNDDCPDGLGSEVKYRAGASVLAAEKSLK